MNTSIKSLYRTHRPKTFAEVVGQGHITKTLINQIANGKVAHAYLFSGTRGVGKTSVAKIFAREVNRHCEERSNPGPQNDFHLDIFEIDAASNNGVDAVRELIEKVKYPPVTAKYKVYIIDEVHMFSTSAFNALLKTLEEPPSHVIFILATTEPHKLPATVLSRCLRFDFRPPATPEIVALLNKVLKKENIIADKDAVQMLATAGNGSFRDALSLAETVASYTNSAITAEAVAQVLGAVDKTTLQDLLTAILAKDIKKITGITQQIFSVGRNISAVTADFLDTVKHHYIATVDRQSMEIYRIFAELAINIKTAVDAHTMFEGACLLCTMN